ncbi:MAG TPA: fatty acid desaturase [Bryobacteraceae bacterium]|nr:fatty acid desaturase [Bryobacteraceae bacterium]
MIAIDERTPAGFEAEDRQARVLVKDLHKPRPAVYWLDLLSSCAVGWSAFALAAWLPFSAATIGLAAVAVFALYRALCFLHEISHMNRGSLRGFEAAWNALIGFPLLMPSFVYVGVHQSHHSLSTYGTSQDPEYLPFAKSRRMTLAFALESFLIPAALLIRFLVLGPVGLLVPRFHNWLVAHASALTMNFAWTRHTTPELLRRIRRDTVFILLLWSAAVALLPWRVLLVWFGVVSVASFVNTLRTLVAHRYEGDGEPLDRGGQLQDSIDVPGAVWTELWAPVGLRYHALHHYFPGIPYHNLAEANARLMSSQPGMPVYGSVSSPGLLASLRRLIHYGE